MNRRALAFASLAVFLSAASVSAASDLQKALRSRWLGAWVVTSTESYSDCSGMATNNRVNGTLVRGSGSRVFEAGELAKLNKVDAKRSRLDLHLTLVEPVLLDYLDGPFTLYREAECKIELQLELPRAVIKSGDVTAVEHALAAILERHTTQASAKDSPAWNARRRKDYPEDYRHTLAEHQLWQAANTNASVQAQLDRAVTATEELSQRLQSDPDYLAGFARGVEEARAENLSGCPRLLAVDLAGFKRKAAKAAEDDPSAALEARGFQDGRQLVYGLAMIRHLGDCFVPLPETDDD